MLCACRSNPPNSRHGQAHGTHLKMVAINCGKNVDASRSQNWSKNNGDNIDLIRGISWWSTPLNAATYLESKTKISERTHGAWLKRLESRTVSCLRRQRQLTNLLLSLPKSLGSSVPWCDPLKLWWLPRACRKSTYKTGVDCWVWWEEEKAVIRCQDDESTQHKKRTLPQHPCLRVLWMALESISAQFLLLLGLCPHSKMLRNNTSTCGGRS